VRKSLRQPQRRIVFVKPVDDEFQATPGIETRRSGIWMRQRLSPGRRIVQVGPFGFEEEEVAHAIRLMRVSRSLNVSIISFNEGGVSRNMSRIS